MDIVSRHLILLSVSPKVSLFTLVRNLFFSFFSLLTEVCGGGRGRDCLIFMPLEVVNEKVGSLSWRNGTETLTRIHRVIWIKVWRRLKGRDGLGVWDEQMETTVYIENRTDKQQGATYYIAQGTIFNILC